MMMPSDVSAERSLLRVIASNARPSVLLIFIACQRPCGAPPPVPAWRRGIYGSPASRSRRRRRGRVRTRHARDHLRALSEPADHCGQRAVGDAGLHREPPQAAVNQLPHRAPVRRRRSGVGRKLDSTTSLGLKRSAAAARAARHPRDRARSMRSTSCRASAPHPGWAHRSPSYR